LWAAAKLPTTKHKNKEEHMMMTAKRQQRDMSLRAPGNAKWGGFTMPMKMVGNHIFTVVGRSDTLLCLRACACRLGKRKLLFFVDSWNTVGQVLVHF
jgi:hypothetical protein